MDTLPSPVSQLLRRFIGYPRRPFTRELNYKTVEYAAWLNKGQEPFHIPSWIYNDDERKREDRDWIYFDGFYKMPISHIMLYEPYSSDEDS